MSLNGPISPEESNGAIASLDLETGAGTIRLDTGEVITFDPGNCYRDGTSFSYMQVGDRCKVDGPFEIAGKSRVGVSSPNGRRWNPNA